MGGREERFCDIGKMICRWEEMEGNDQEWKVEEGVRRRGRRVSRRISELLGKFEGGGGSVGNIVENIREKHYCQKIIYLHLYLHYQNQTLKILQVVLKLKSWLWWREQCQRIVIG